jgi:replication factor C subunit 1
MDIRNFFSKKGDPKNGDVTKKKKVEIASEEKKVSQRQKPKGVDVKQSRNYDDDDDDDDVILIDSPVDIKKRKVSQQQSRTKSTDKKNHTDIAASSKSKTPRKIRERDIFLDDSSDDDDDDDDVGFVPVDKSSSVVKKQKIVVESNVAHNKIIPKIESTNDVVPRSSPRTRKTPPPSVVNPTPPTKHSIKKKRVSVTSKVTEPSHPTIFPSTMLQEEIDINALTPQCLVGLTFCLSGIIPDVSRDEATEMIKILGGRVTGAVSNKTTYLVIGDILEDGRPVEEGSKYIRATLPESKTILVPGKNYLYGLIQQYSDHITQPNNEKSNNIPSTNTVSVDSIISSAAPKNSAQISNTTSQHPKKMTEPTPATIKKTNPYINSNTAATTSNPYARKSNPYAKASTTTTSKTVATTDDRKMPAVIKSSSVVTKSHTDTTQLWVDKYKPKHSSEILGNQDAVRKLSVWLASWEQCFNHNSNKKIKSFSAANGPWKAALLSGPPGIGSTFILNVTR